MKTKAYEMRCYRVFYIEFPGGNTDKQIYIEHIQNTKNSSEVQKLKLNYYGHSVRIAIFEEGIIQGLTSGKQRKTKKTLVGWFILLPC